MTEKRRAGIIASAVLAAATLSPGCASPPPAHDGASGNTAHNRQVKPPGRVFTPNDASFGPPHRDGSIFTDEERLALAKLMVQCAIEQNQRQADFTDGKMSKEELNRATADIEKELAAGLAAYIDSGLKRGHPPEEIEKEIREIGKYVQSRSTAGKVSKPLENNRNNHPGRSR